MAEVGEKPLIENPLVGATATLVFLSHSHLDKERATEVKGILRTIGLEGFVAHEDIEPTLEWQDEILARLRTCRGLTVLATEGARSSPWVSQEVGAAVIRGVGIVSISLGAAPFGFLYRHQAVRWRLPKSEKQMDLRDAAEANIPALYHALEKVGVATRDNLIEGIGRTRSFEEARVVAAVLARAGQLDPLQAARLAYLIDKNSNVSGCWDAQRLFPSLIKPFSEILPPDLVDSLASKDFHI